MLMPTSHEALFVFLCAHLISFI